MTNFMRNLLYFFTLLYVTACSSPKGYMLHPDYKTLNNALYDNTFPLIIEDDGSATDLVFQNVFKSGANYLEKYEALNALNLKSKGLEEICQPANLTVVEDFLSASPINLHLTFLMYTCAKLDEDEARINATHAAFKKVVQFIQTTGSGLTPEDPIQLTDYQDIELLSYVSETTVLGIEVKQHSNGTSVVAHTFDRGYQRFSYRYYSMSKYLQSKVAPISGALAPVNVLNILREASLDPKTNNIGLLMRGKQLFHEEKYEFLSVLLLEKIKAMEKADTNLLNYFDNYTPLVTLFAQSLLAEKKFVAFDKQRSKLEEAAARGSIEAIATLALRELMNEEPDTGVIQKNLDEIAYIYEQETAELVFLKQIIQQPKYAKLIQKWLGESPTPAQLNSVLELSRRYKFGQVDYFDRDRILRLTQVAHQAKVDGSKTQRAFIDRFFTASSPNFAEEYRLYSEAVQETQNPEYKFEAHYQLAEIYFSGNDSVSVDKSKALTHYQQAASNGHLQAAYALAKHAINGDYPEITLAETTRLLEKSASLRPDAYCILGDMQLNSDQQVAKQAFLKGAILSQPSCAFKLGMLEKSNENYAVAGYWFRKSARAEYLPAIEQLALLYQQGLGTEVNEQKAKVLLNYLRGIPFE